MNWHRIHYTATSPEGESISECIDVLAEVVGDACYTYDAWRAIRAKQPVDLMKAITLLYIGESDGSLAVNRDPRDTEPGIEFQIRASRD